MAKSYQLFRPEAQAAKRIQLVSHIRLDPAPQATWTVIGGFVFALSMQIPRKETTRGYSVSSPGLVSRWMT